MTISSKAADTVRKMRALLRDVAAAEAGHAAAQTEVAAAAVESEQVRLRTTTTEATVALHAVTNVHALDQISDVVACQHANVATAEAGHVAATRVSDLATARLRGRIRQLKTVERVVEQIRDERNVREAKAEQSRNDDLNARRR
jgi:hypothetical protein